MSIKRFLLNVFGHSMMHNDCQKWTTYWSLSMQIWGRRWTVFPTILFESIVSWRAETTLTFIAGNLTIPVWHSGIIITVKCVYAFRNLLEIENKMYLITLKSESPLAPHLSKYPGFDSGSQAVGDTLSCFHADRSHSRCWQERCSENIFVWSQSEVKTSVSCSFSYHMKSSLVQRHGCCCLLTTYPLPFLHAESFFSLLNVSL